MITTSTPRFTDPSYFAKHPSYEYLFICSACIGQLLTNAASNCTLTHMNQLLTDFDVPESMKPWFMASFGLAIGTVILISGRLGDVYGIKRVLIGGYIWTVVWSILCGISYYNRKAGAAMYICCRAFQGAGMAFVLPNILGAAGRVYSPRTLRKNLVFGCIGFAAPFGGWLGVFMSGVIAVRTGRWDWNYYALAMFAFLGGFITYISFPYIQVIQQDDNALQDVDWIGGFLGITSLTLFNFSWNQAPVVGWQSAYILVLLIVGFAMFFAFIYWELKIAKNPLLPPKLLQNSRLMSLLATIFLGWGAFGINLYHTYSMYLDLRHYSPFEAGAGLSPVPPMGLLAAISCTLMIQPRTVDLILVGSMLAFTGASIILCTAKVHESYFRNTFGAWMIGSFGMDWSFPAGSIILSEELPPHLQGMAGSLISIVVYYGVSIMLGVAGTIETELLNQNPDDAYRAWRGAEYYAVGISGLAAVIAIITGRNAIWAFITNREAPMKEVKPTEKFRSSETKLETPSVTEHITEDTI